MVHPTLNEQEVAAILTALNFWSDINNNKYLTDEQYQAAISAMGSIEREL